MATPTGARALRWLALLGGWVVLSLALGTTIFLNSSRAMIVASHHSVLSPTLSGHIVLRTGPVLPDVRLPSGGRIGVDLALGKTEAVSVEELVNRYAFLASHPEGQIAAVRTAVLDMALSAALRGGVLAGLPFGLWWLVGATRRSEMTRAVTTRRSVVGLTVIGLAALLLVQPWNHPPPAVEEEESWIPLAEFVGVSLPPELESVQVDASSTSTESRRLVQSAIDTYQLSKTWYADAAAVAASLDLRTPQADETVVVLVSDRHDNVGMDAVVRAIADAGGATIVFSAGDETSSGASWEAFSLDSLNKAFEGYDRFAVAGNHDQGDFVSDYLRDLGWTDPDGEVIDGPGGSVLAGADDPRSSGLGNWRDETGLSFSQHADLVADSLCAAEDRVGTLLVHDADTGQPALERGCVDLVVGGHLHVQLGPTRVLGANGEVGYSYTNGTTGGAAYAIAVGSKLRRAAEVTLITYRDGRPVGLQPVVLQTDGRFDVAAFVELGY